MMFFTKKFSFLFFILFFCIDSAYTQPNLIPNLAVWLSADSVVLNGSTVQQWTDRSGTNHAIQNNALQEPTLVTNVPQLNSHPVLSFDGIDDFLEIADNPSIDFLDQMSIFIVTMLDTVKTNEALLCKWDYASQGSWAFQTDFFVDDEMMFFVANALTDGGNNRISTDNANNNDSIFYMMSVIYNGNEISNSDRIKIFKNRDSLNTSVTGSISSILQNSSATLKIGMFGGDLSRYYNGDIAEIIIYNAALTPIQRQQIEQYLSNKYAPPVNLGPDINISYGFCPIVIQAGKPWLYTFQWNTGETSDSIIVNNSGTYSLSAWNIFNFPSYDTLNITYPGNFKPFSDTTICPDDTLIWNTQLSKNGYSFKWNNDSAISDSVFFITQAGQYFVEVSDSFGCQLFSDTITVAIDSFPSLNFLNNDTSLCAGNSITTLIPAQTYSWSTGDSSATIVVDSSNIYSITVTNANGCKATDSINVTIIGTAPTVNFSATEVCLGDTTQFSDFSSSDDSIINWNWNFGDSVFSTVNNPNHIYSSAGNFIVSLFVETDAGCSNSKSDTVIVHSLPQANFAVNNQLLCSQDEIYFNDSSQNSEGNITTWQWNFNDGTFDSVQNPIHVFDSAKIFNVELIAENSFGCIDSFSKNISINPKPVAEFFSVYACEDDTVIFYDNSVGIITNWQWDFGNGKNSTETNPTNIYDTAGNYNVLLIVSTVFGCRDTVAQPVSVYYKPIANFTATDFCRGTPIQVFDNSSVAGSSISQWNWNVISTNISSSEKNPFFVFDTNAANSYLLKLIVTSDKGCSDSATKLITVHNSPIADFSSPAFGDPPLTVNFTNLSDDSAVNFVWSFGTSDSSTLKNPVYTFSDSGEFEIQLIAYSQFGCTDTFVKIIKARKSILDIAVTKVRTTTSNNFLKISADLYNTGNVPISNFEIFSELTSFPSVKENWNGFLDEKKDTTYTFSAAFELLKNTLPDVICVRVENPNSTGDADSSNNEMCISFSDFKILSLYPNPASNEIILEYILTGKSESLQIIIYDEIGKKVEELQSSNGQKGLHRATFDISNFSNGIYALKIIYGENYEVKRFMKY